MAREEKKKPGEESETNRLEKVKAVASIIQSVLITFSIIAAGIWFLAQSEASPKANISHEVTHRRLNDNWIWVHVAITVTNPGKRPLYLKNGTFRIQGILPLDINVNEQIKNDANKLISPGLIGVQWPQIGNAYEKVPINERVDPGESEKLNIEFIIPSFLQTIKIYSHFEKAQGIGWTATTIYQLSQ
jgi:hypothetical protein